MSNPRNTKLTLQDKKDNLIAHLQTSKIFKDLCQKNIDNMTYEQVALCALLTNSDLNFDNYDSELDKREANLSKQTSLPPISQPSRLDLDDNLCVLPVPILEEVISYLPLNAKASLRATAKYYKNRVDAEMVSDLNKVITFILESPHIAIPFIKYFRSTQTFELLANKFKLNSDTISNKEIICYTLTTDDINLIDIVKLKSAISEQKKLLQKNETEYYTDAISPNHSIDLDKFKLQRKLIISLETTELSIIRYLLLLKKKILESRIEHITNRKERLNEIQRLIEQDEFLSDLLIKYDLLTKNNFSDFDESLQNHWNREYNVEFNKFNENSSGRSDKFVILNLKAALYYLDTEIRAKFSDHDVGHHFIPLQQKEGLFTNLAGSCFENIKLSQKNLSFINFENANLERACMHTSMLIHSCFKKTNMNFVELIDAQFDANLLQANMYGCFFIEYGRCIGDMSISNLSNLLDIAKLIRTNKGLDLGLIVAQNHIQNTRAYIQSAPSYKRLGLIRREIKNINDMILDDLFNHEKQKSKSISIFKKPKPSASVSNLIAFHKDLDSDLIKYKKTNIKRY